MMQVGTKRSRTPSQKIAESVASAPASKRRKKNIDSKSMVKVYEDRIIKLYNNGFERPGEIAAEIRSKHGLAKTALTATQVKNKLSYLKKKGDDRLQAHPVSKGRTRMSGASPSTGSGPQWRIETEKFAREAEGDDNFIEDDEVVEREDEEDPADVSVRSLVELGKLYKFEHPTDNYMLYFILLHGRSHLSNGDFTEESLALEIRCTRMQDAVVERMGVQALEAHFPPQVHVFELIPPEGALFDATASPVLTVMDLDGNVLPTPVDKNEASANKPERWAAIKIMLKTEAANLGWEFV